MPKSPSGEKRPADTASNAVHVMRLATGEVPPEEASGLKNAAAVTLGRLGGEARAESLSRARRRSIAKKAAKSRWSKKRPR